MHAAEQMSAVDRAWLLMDQPTNPMMIIGLLVLERPLSLARLRRLVRSRFLRFERFARIPRSDSLSGRWEHADRFRLEDHVLPAALPEPAGKTQLQALAGELASAPLNRGRPLWSFHLIERYGRGSALIVRIHHCYADGIALIQVLTALADPATGAAPPPVPSLPPTAQAASLIEQWLPKRLTEGWREGTDLLEKGLRYVLHPTEATTASRGLLDIATEVARLGVLLPDDPLTRLKQPLSGVKQVAWAAPLALEEVRTLARLLGTTINDVLIATLAGALGRYLEQVGDRTAGLSIRATVPVNLRPPASSYTELGNRFGLMFVELPIGIRHPLERLYTVHKATQQLKGTPQAWVTFGLLAVVGSLPSAVEAPAIALFSAKASLVASNLRGPAEPLYLGGVPVTELLFWVPQTGSIGTGVSIFSYAGGVQFGVIADRQLIADPDTLVQLVHSEFDRLVFLVLLGGAALEE